MKKSFFYYVKIKEVDFQYQNIKKVSKDSIKVIYDGINNY